MKPNNLFKASDDNIRQEDFVLPNQLPCKNEPKTTLSYNFYIFSIPVTIDTKLNSFIQNITHKHKNCLTFMYII